MIPLKFAVLCLDCQHISDSRTDTCPACSQRSLMSLSRILNPIPDFGEITSIQCDA